MVLKVIVGSMIDSSIIFSFRIDNNRRSDILRRNWIRLLHIHCYRFIDRHLLQIGKEESLSRTTTTISVRLTLSFQLVTIVAI